MDLAGPPLKRPEKSSEAHQALGPGPVTARSVEVAGVARVDQGRAQAQAISSARS
jgi:hypothetical protein